MVEAIESGVLTRNVEMLAGDLSPAATGLVVVVMLRVLDGG
jgi:hypothetical protein